MKAEILKVLRESRGHVSGQELCERFQVSRTAIWKVISQLKEEGYEIEAVRNKGYRLQESPDVLSKEEMESRIETRTIGKCVEYYAETDSTNIRAKQAAGQGAVHGTLFVADRQVAETGRVPEKDAEEEVGIPRKELRFLCLCCCGRSLFRTRRRC